MTQNSELQVTITLSESAWRAIVDLLYHACQLRGNDWIRWQGRIAQTILGAIEAARVPEEPYIGDDGKWVYPQSWDESDINDWWWWLDHQHDFDRDEEAAAEHFAKEASGR